MRVSKYLCRACVSENYNQTTESYAQAAARDAVVVGGCIVATRLMLISSALCKSCQLDPPAPTWLVKEMRALLSPAPAPTGPTHA